MTEPTFTPNLNPASNSLKHGLSATDEMLCRHLRVDEKDSFNDLRAILIEHHKPQNSVESLLVEKIAINHFRLFRLYKLEYFAGSESAKFPLAPESIVHHLDRFSRYDSRISNQLNQLNQILRTAQRQRETLHPASQDENPTD